VGDIVEIRLGHDLRRPARLARLINEQSRHERTAQARRRWTGLLAVASLPIWVASLFPAALGAGLRLVAQALWAASLLAVIWSACAEWRSRRLLRALLVEARAVTVRE
jgi:hypothetical protein